MRNKLAGLFSWVLTVSYTLFPSQSQAMQAVDELMDNNESPKNVQKEIRWTKSLSKYYAKALMSAHCSRKKRLEEAEKKKLVKLFVTNRWHSCDSW